MSRTRAVAKGTAALLVLAVIAGGIPWALTRFVGWPLPHRLPTWAQFSAAVSQHGIPDSTLIKALACVMWIGWTLLLISLAVETYAAARGATARRLAIVGPLQPSIGNLVAAVAIAALSITPRSNPAPARPLAASIPALKPPVPAAVLVAATAGPATAFAGPSPTALGSDAETGATARTYVVRRNDTLWGIAERELGDPLRWRDIYNLNHGRTQPGGTTLTDPHWIDPGWTLLLPAAASAPAQAPSHPAAPASTSPSTPPPPTTTGPPSLAIRASTAPDPSTAPVHAPTHNLPTTTGAHPTSVTLPSGSVIGASFAAGVLSTVAIGRLRRRHGYQPAPPEPGRSLAPPPLGPTIRRLSAALAAPDGEPDAAPPPEQLAEGGEDRRIMPDLVEIGEHDGTTVTTNLTDLSGVALCGQDADRVARAWTAALLARAGPLAAAVVATVETAGRIFGSGREPAGVRTSPEASKAIRILEAEIVARTRLLESSDAQDAVSYRRTNPAEPLPSIVFLFDPPTPDEAARIKHTIGHTPRLGIVVIFLADTPAAAARVRLEQDRVADVEPYDRLAWLAGARLFGLTVTETADILATLSDAEFRPTSETDPEWTETIERMEHPPPPAEAWPTNTVRSDQVERPVRICALGPLTITVMGNLINRGLRSVAKELLVYYLLRPEGATVEQAVDNLWPDTDPKLVHRQFWTAASNLRSRLREWGDLESKILEQVGEIYRLDPDVVSTDLWDFQDALNQAAQNDDYAIVALHRAVAAYSGDLAQTAGWLWIEPAREDLHRRAVDVHLRLAELEESRGDPAASIAVLEKTIDLDRYAEEPYRRLMTLRARQGQLQLVKETWRQLQRRLVEIDLDPDPTTARLYHHLVPGDSAA